MEKQIPKPKIQGKFVFKDIMEGVKGSGDCRIITFRPPLTIAYTIWEKTNSETGEQNYEEDYPLMAFATYDFGLTLETPLDLEHNWLVNGYQGLTKDSGPEDILMGSLNFDLFHAFFHETMDPNYTHYHWALVGWLKGRAICQEEGA